MNFTFIEKVVLSCTSRDQKNTAYNWINVLYNQNKINKTELLDLILKLNP